MTTRSRQRHLLAILSGVMLTAGFPPTWIPWIHWFALIPLLFAVKGISSSQAFRLGYVTGLAHYLTLIYWVLFVLEHYGGLNLFVSSGVLVLFCLYLALYPAAFAWALALFKGSGPAVFFSGALWVSLELLRGVALTGFPWCLLGHGRYEDLVLIQGADLFGVSILSFLVVTVNVLLYATPFDRKFSGRGILKWETVMVALILLAALAYGRERLNAVETGPVKERLRVAVLQGNVDQSVKWHPSYQEETIARYERLTREALPFEPDMIVWPETAVPFFFQEDTPLSRRVRGLALSTGADTLLGSPAYGRRDGTLFYYNRAYGLPQGDGAARHYDKVHLVPYGEYVPLKRFLPFVRRLVQAAGDFSAGVSVEPIPLRSASAGILICFEIIFPRIAREHCRSGADILVNLTNDAWFGMSSAPYQHLAMAVFRAVENRRPVIRAANTGFSAFIHPSGRILERSELFEEAVLTGVVSAGAKTPSPYTRLGDVLAWAFLLVSLIKLSYVLWYTK